MFLLVFVVLTILFFFFQLPEGTWNSDPHLTFAEDDLFVVPYPYQPINSFYINRRKKFRYRVAELPDHPSDFIHIDSFIKNKCDHVAIQKLWQEGGFTGLYPPSSLQKLLRILLLPNFSMEDKHVIFVYVFMDIYHILKEGRFLQVARNLIKFPAVFQMDPAVIKITQAFWYLDHGELEVSNRFLVHFQKNK